MHGTPLGPPLELCPSALHTSQGSHQVALIVVLIYGGTPEMIDVLDAGCFASAGRRQDDDTDTKNRRAKADRGNDDTENAKKLVRDLVDAFNGFGVSSVALPSVVTLPFNHPLCGSTPEEIGERVATRCDFVPAAEH